MDSCLTVDYVTSRLPFRPHSGGQLREYEILRRRPPNIRLRLWVSTQFLEDDEKGLDAANGVCDEVHLFSADANPPRTEKPDRVVRQMSHQMNAALSEVWQTAPPDVVHIEGYYMYPCLPAWDRVPVVLVEENVEYLVDLDHYEKIENRPNGSALAARTRQFEQRVWAKATLIGALTAEDQEVIANTVGEQKTFRSPNGCDHVSPVTVPQGRTPTAGFLGNYSYGPSRDAALQLLNEVWPRVRLAVPGAEFRMIGAGREFSPELDKPCAGVHWTGTVECVAAEMAKLDVMVAPLRSGGGIKVKILESVRLGIPVVTTPVGVQGLPLPVRELILVSEAAADIARLTVEILSDPDRRAGISKALRAHEKVLSCWDDAAEALFECWRQAGSDFKLRHDY